MEKKFLDAIADGALVLDGAMGTQLYERGILYSVCYEELNVTRPELVRRVHEDYLRAGAQILETNTFGANAMRLEKYGLQSRVRELNLAAVNVAKEAAQGHAYIAGAIGPSAAVTEQVEALVEGGVDVLLIETIRHPIELEAAVKAARHASNGKVPIAATVTLDEAGLMADGTNAADIARAMKEFGADIIGVNCSHGPMGVLAAATRMIPIGLPVMAAPNAGLPRRKGERLVYVITPEDFGAYARRMYEIGVKAVGGCCGTTPEHIHAIRV